MKLPVVRSSKIILSDLFPQFQGITSNIRRLTKGVIIRTVVRNANQMSRSSWLLEAI